MRVTQFESVSLPLLAYSLYLALSSFVIRPQHLAISLTTSVTFAVGLRANISGRFYQNRSDQESLVQNNKLLATLSQA